MAKQKVRCQSVTMSCTMVVQDFPNLESEYRGQSFKMMAAWYVHNSSEGLQTGGRECRETVLPQSS